MWTQLGEFATKAGPWVLLVSLLLFLVWTYYLVRLVLTKSVRNPGDTDVSVWVRPYPWPRVEVDVRVLPRAEVRETRNSHYAESLAEVVPPVITTERQLTPNQILSLAGIDPAANYLVQVQGRHQVSYEGRGDELIRVHENAMFVSVSTGPTPTS